MLVFASEALCHGGMPHTALKGINVLTYMQHPWPIRLNV